MMQNEQSTNPPARRAAVIGTGFMGRTHARAVRAAGGDVVVAVGSGTRSAEDDAKSIGAQTGANSLDDVLRRKDIDVVHICTPNDTHEEFAVRALDAGKAVICEKPLAIDLAGAERIIRAAQSAGSLGTVPFVYRFHPLARELRARVLRGDAGTISVVHGGYLQDWLADTDVTNWRVNAARGGLSRAFADIGSHWCDLFEFVTNDRITRLSALKRTLADDRGNDKAVSTEDSVSLHFTTAGGILGTAVISQMAAGRKNRLHLEISGNETSFAFDQERPDELWLGRQDQSMTVARDPAKLLSEAARLSFLPAGHPQGYQDAFAAFVRDSYDTFSGVSVEGVPMLVDGLRAARLCDAVMTSAASEGAWVEVAEASVDAPIKILPTAAGSLQH